MGILKAEVEEVEGEQGQGYREDEFMKFLGNNQRVSEPEL